MHIGFTISEFNGLQTARLIRLAQKLGVRFFELNRSALDDLEEIGQVVGDMPTGYHLPLIEEDGFDLASTGHAQEIERTISLLNQHRRRLNLQYALTHPPYLSGDRNAAEATAMWLDNLERIEAPILLENDMNWQADAFEALCGQVRQRLEGHFRGICFDGPHAFLRWGDVFEGFKAVAGQIKAVHLSDCTESEDAHLPLGQGVFPVSRFLGMVHAHGIDGFLVLEIRPRSLREFKALIDSYLLVLKTMHPLRYMKTVLSLSWSMRGIKRELQQIAQELQRRGAPVAK